jgi:hydroxymethylbilane synthase
MRELEGGCSVPIGAETRWVEGKLRLRATVVSVTGKEGVDVEVLETVASEEEANDLGKRVAKDLVSKGADKILNAINKARPEGK